MHIFENLNRENRMCQTVRENSNLDIINPQLNSLTKRLQTTNSVQSLGRGLTVESEIANKETHTKSPESSIQTQKVSQIKTETIEQVIPQIQVDSIQLIKDNLKG